ncbi:exodeoxyribonuclease III [Pseudomonas sp. PvP001]
MKKLKIATFNVNGIRAHQANLIAWLERDQPDIVCLQELKAADKDFPASALEAVGYGALWHGQSSWNGVAILARDAQPLESRRGLPGDPDEQQSRYLEAAVHGVLVGCLYLPNGNPQPGPKFDYKLAWFERLIEHARTLQSSDHPVVLAGDYNVVPTDQDIYSPKSWLKDALLQPESREAYARLLEQGWTDALRALYPEERILHLLGLLSPALAEEFRIAYRSPAAQPGTGAVPDGRRRGCLGAQRGTRQRPCADLDPDRHTQAQALMLQASATPRRRWAPLRSNCSVAAQPRQPSVTDTP